jgi:drug/metabolite transporter (DMT)-like permease
MTMAESKRLRAAVLLVTAAMLWSLAGVLIKGVSLPALALAGFRSAIALPVLLVFSDGGP